LHIRLVLTNEYRFRFCQLRSSEISMRNRIFFFAVQPDRHANGGMESATCIFEALANEFDWTLITNRETLRTARWREAGARVKIFPFSDDVPRWQRGARLAAMAARAFAATLRDGPVLIHSNDIRAAQVAMPAVRWLRRPMLHTIRGTKPPGEQYGNSWHNMAERATYVVTLSKEMGDVVGQQLNLPQSKRVTICSMVDLNRFRPAEGKPRTQLRRRLGIEENEFALGLLAGIFANKGQLPFLREVMARLVRQQPNLRLHLLGDYEPDSNRYARECRDTVMALGLEKHVTFHGFTHEADSWLRAVDLVVVPFEREGLARCMIEAMASGTPVVSFDVCSAREMLEETNAGMVVPQGDWAGFVSAVGRLAGDPDMCAAMGFSGRATAVDRFAPDKLARTWIALYNSFF